MGLDFSVPREFRGLLRLGTCSWKYDSWKGLIYELGKSYRPNDYLLDYARKLDSVEVDQWFWSLFPGSLRLPDPAVATTSMSFSNARSLRTFSRVSGISSTIITRILSGILILKSFFSEKAVDLGLPHTWDALVSTGYSDSPNHLC